MAAKKTTKKTESKPARVKPGATWSKEWLDLMVAYGAKDATLTNNWHSLAEEIRVSPQAVWRWAVRGDAVPPSTARLIQILAAMKGVKSPV